MKFINQLIKINYDCFGKNLPKDAVLISIIVPFVRAAAILAGDITRRAILIMAFDESGLIIHKVSQSHDHKALVKLLQANRR